VKLLLKAERNKNMDGVLFYWLLWVMVVFVFFMVDHSSKRTNLLIFLLSTVILSSWSKTYFFVEWNLALFPFLCLCLLIMMKLERNQLIFGFIISFIVANWVWAIHRVIYVEPVWLIISPLWMITVVIFPLVFIFLRHAYTRMFSLLIGIFQGIVLTSIMITVELGGVSTLHEVNSMFLLDVFSLSLFVVASWSELEKVKAKVKKNLIARKYPLHGKQTNV